MGDAVHTSLAKAVSTLFLEAVATLYVRTGSDKSVLSLTSDTLREELDVYSKAQVDSLLSGKPTAGHIHRVSLYMENAGEHRESNSKGSVCASSFCYAACRNTQWWIRPLYLRYAVGYFSRLTCRCRCSPRQLVLLLCFRKHLRFGLQPIIDITTSILATAVLIKFVCT